MDIIKNANILNQEDLLLLENHSLGINYIIYNLGLQNKVTKLMLLINFLRKYRNTPLNNIIKEYVKKVPEEVNNFNEFKYSALIMCIKANNEKIYIETIKILLDNGANVNKQNFYGYTAYHFALSYYNTRTLKLLLEYDSNTAGSYSNVNYKNAIACKIIHNIELLNTKN